MAHWTYYAGKKASLADGLRIARRFKVMWRGAQNAAGALIANAAHLRPGDTIHFAYRSAGQCELAFRAIIDQPDDPVKGAPALGRVGGAAAEALAKAGYRTLRDGRIEVIHLADIEEDVDATPLEPPSNQNALRRGPPVPLEVAAHESKG